MNRDAEISDVREQASILANQVVHLVDRVSNPGAAERDPVSAKKKVAVLESLMRKLRARHAKLKARLN